MRKILVTGGAGFIGSHTVVELVNDGWEPVIVDNFCNSRESVLKGLEEICGRQFTVYKGDCTDLGQMRSVFSENPDIAGAIHFAAYKAVGESVREPLKYYHNNIGSLLVLVQCMTEFEVGNLVFSSSCTVYGQPELLPVSEESPLQQANSPYGFTKQVCEQILQDLASSGNDSVSSVLLRYFNPIGAHSSGLIGELPLGTPENLVPYITQTAAGLRERLTVFGDDYETRDGTCIRDYIHVVDLAKAHVSALNWIQNRDIGCETFNLGSGRGNTVLEAINAFQKASGKTLNYEIGPRRPGDVEQIFASADKAERVLNWTTELNLEDAMRDAWNWQLQLKTKEWETG